MDLLGGFLRFLYYCVGDGEGSINEKGGNYMWQVNFLDYEVSVFVFFFKECVYDIICGQ